MKVAFHTVGCKVNFAETTTITRQFVNRGFQIVNKSDKCDIFVINTCGVTVNAERECRQIIRRIIKRSPETFIIVVGCYAQLNPDEIAKIDGVDVVLGTQEKFRVFDLITSFEKFGTPRIFVSSIDKFNDFIPSYTGEVNTRTRAFIKVQDGCDYRCAFCTIPLARGRSRSTSIEDLILQAEILEEYGYKEIVLAGINVGDFGKDRGEHLLDLLKAFENRLSIPRIRISSIEPDLLNRELIDFILSSGVFCNHFHIPLQSGSDAILRRMQRRYMTKDYRAIVEYIKEHDESACIGTDVLVGFPGETDELFQETFSFIENLPISYLHVFSYSKRPNTFAENFPNQVEPKTRIHRNHILQDLGKEKRLNFYHKHLGSVLSVLFEKKLKNGKITGLTRNYIRVEADNDPLHVNNIRDVKILKIGTECCEGTVIDIDKTKLLPQLELIQR